MSEQEMTAENNSESVSALAIKQTDDLLSGDNEYAEKKNLQFILNLLDSVDYKSKTAYKLCSAIETLYSGEIQGAGITFPKKKDGNNLYYHDDKKRLRPQVSKKDWKNLQTYFSQQLEEVDTGAPQPVLDNFYRLCDYIGLPEQDKEIVDLVYCVSQDDEMKQLLSYFLDNKKDRIGAAMACMLGKPEQANLYSKSLSVKGPLIAYNLLLNGNTAFNDIDSFSAFPKLDPYLMATLDRSDMSKDEIMNVVLGDTRTSELSLDDFSYKGEDLEYVVELIKNAVERKEKGVNIILHGPPGSGKTALAETIATHLGYKLYVAGEEDDQSAMDVSVMMEYDFIPPDMMQTSEARRASLQRMQAMLKDSEKTVLLFDEIEDLLLKGTDTSKSADTDSKIKTNRLLEDNPVVTIWTGNDPEKFHEAVRQRFTISLHMGYPPTKIRQKIWQRQLEMNNVSLSDEETLSLAREYQAPPRMIAKAAKAAGRMNDKMKAIKKSLQSDARLSFGNVNVIKSQDSVTSDFDLSLINAGDNTEEKVADLINRGNKREPFSLLAKGKKEEGLQTTLRYIAENTTMNIMEVSMGALLAESPFSSPANNIASAFATAANEGAFLVVHNVDLIVANPTKETVEWNSGLAALFNDCADEHSLPYAVTTSLDLPEIFTHRYSDELKFGFMRKEQFNSAMKSYFDLEADSLENTPEGLVVGDFEDVKKLLKHNKKQELSAEVAVQYLEKQKSFRKAGDKPGIGFMS
jgi:Holliday junction resolvasome RuvABC ATP-dependent DNA helicase subunit